MGKVAEQAKRLAARFLASQDKRVDIPYKVHCDCPLTSAGLGILL